MPKPNTTFRRLREQEWKASRTEAAQKIIAKSVELGEPVECSARTIAFWEDGETACPRAIYQRVLHALTGRSAAELGFTPPWTAAAPVPAAEAPPQEIDMNRRHLLLAAGAAVLLPVIDADRPGGRLGDPHVTALLDAEQRLYDQDRAHGSAQLNREATAALHRAHDWLRHGRYDETTGRRLHTATGMLSVAAGWLALDSGRTADARSLYTEALVSARQADDSGLEAHAFACLSLLATSAGRPREAVATAEAAQRAAAGLGSPRWLSLLHMREARAWALQGDRTLTERALVHAYDLFAHGSTDADPAWLEFYVPGELAGLESLCRADLGQHERASAGAEQAVMLFSADHTRNRALYTADIALHHARKPAPDLDAAADAAHRTLAYLTDVRSERLERSLRDITGTLTPHKSVTAVADYLAAYREAVPA
ncbi:hypothetical protein POF50_011280 [Streptomyces sp. SL13]|uniref:XRE family transcriptional regulator n=1 Tax=Streptantibioticus silvisoli TaxID=2705255 RepID=A0AA90JXA4_9ACTN|nr:hypothetical protein [Streptantibioticus silvisoli]MDI5969911.1 hypothetical protein [Streptantibioticus silvisoli]